MRKFLANQKCSLLVIYLGLQTLDWLMSMEGGFGEMVFKSLGLVSKIAEIPYSSLELLQ